MSFDEWVGFEIPDEISDQAAQWIARLDSDKISDTDYKEFSKWLDSDPINRHAFEELSEMWARLETLGEHRDLLEESKVLEFPGSSTPSETHFHISSSWQPITAIILISIGLLIPIIEKLLN
jgi:ferric-dicitrate binding protein FerR (iron transport regulator)